MARIEKYSTGIIGVVKHNIREFKNGKCPTNMEVDPQRTNQNYSIIRRGKTAKEIEKYRKKIEQECFKYNRKNLIHANEVICTLPSDCPPEQEKLFFEESFKYVCSTLPMGERCIFLAEVHADEGRILKNKRIISEGQKHLHIMYVPAVDDTKHEGFNFKLCSDQLTKRAKLKEFHPNYQKWLDKAGVKATVASGVTSGKGISVKSLKEFSKATGLSLEQITTIKEQNIQLQSALNRQTEELISIHTKLDEKNNDIVLLKQRLEEATEKLECAQQKLEIINQQKEKQNLNWGQLEHWGTTDEQWGNQQDYEEEKLW